MKRLEMLTLHTCARTYLLCQLDDALDGAIGPVFRCFQERNHSFHFLLDLRRMQQIASLITEEMMRHYD